MKLVNSGHTKTCNMKIKKYPSWVQLRRLYYYDRLTGYFYHKRNTGRGRKGQRAGLLRQDGYYSISINGQTWLAHRLAWFYCHCEWPDEVDHKDRNRSNNAVSNLRPVTRTQNNGNSNGWGPLKKSGLPRGVYFHPCDKTRFRAQIFINYKAVHLGVFDTVADAVEAYTIAARQHFGEFAT